MKGFQYVWLGLALMNGAFLVLNVEDGAWTGVAFNTTMCVVAFLFSGLPQLFARRILR